MGLLGTQSNRAFIPLTMLPANACELAHSLRSERPAGWFLHVGSPICGAGKSGRFSDSVPALGLWGSLRVGSEQRAGNK